MLHNVTSISRWAKILQQHCFIPFAIVIVEVANEVLIFLETRISYRY